MTVRTVKAGFENGMEARSVAMLVQIAGKYDSSIRIERSGRSMNAKSIMGMISLEIENGDEVGIFAEGPDEETAVSELGEFLQKGCTE